MNNSKSRKSFRSAPAADAASAKIRSAPAAAAAAAKLSTALIAAPLSVFVVTAGAVVPAGAQLSQSDFLPVLTPLHLNAPKTRPLKSREKETLEDLFRRSDLHTASAPPLSLAGVPIPGLSDKALGQLSMNFFVVSTGPRYTSMSEIYGESRAEGKCNFVTVDSILHPYFAFANGMLASAIEESVYGDLRRLLQAMLKSSISDYRRTDDDEVKDDVQRNLAFLCVALKLLDPQAKLPDIGGAQELVAADYELVSKGKRGRSQIFSMEVDFATFQPWGFMRSTPRLSRFFRSYQWLSRMHFPLSNITNNSITGGGNSFRRAVLLFRSLVLADLSQTPEKLSKDSALVVWNKIATMAVLTGFDTSAKKLTIIPPELAPVLNTSDEEFDRLLGSLSQPFLRTKLLLSVRKQRPVELNARSVFEMGENAIGASDDVVFRLFPLTDPPELSWLRQTAHDYVEPGQGPASQPLALLSLHARGAQQATNILASQLDSLDRGLSKSVPRLERLVRVVSPAELAADRHWSIVSLLFRPYPEGAQLCLKTESWLSRQLETAMAAWIDSYCALKTISKDLPLRQSGLPEEERPVNDSAGSSAPNAVSASKTGTAPGKGKDRRAHFHYLEPRVDLYNQLQSDCRNLVYHLTQLHYMPERYRPRSEDFLRLFSRLAAISESELKSEPLSAADFNLLSAIDRVLSPVDTALGSYIYLDDAGFEGDNGVPSAAQKGNSDPKFPSRKGATIGTGRAGKLYIILSTTKGPTLTRGGCYTYLEMQGGPTREEHWQRKLSYGLLLPPSWTRKFTFSGTVEATDTALGPGGRSRPSGSD